MPKNDERTQFEYKDHDPTRYAVESIIAFVPLKFVPETKVFRLYAGTVEALNIAVKHHDDMDTPVESTRKPAASRRNRLRARRRRRDEDLRELQEKKKMTSRSRRARRTMRKGRKRRTPD